MSELVYIEKLAFGGQGIGKLPGGKKVFVYGAYPGELVEVKIISEKKDYSIGEVENIIEKIPERRVPKCPYFRKCGGCDFLDLNYEKQLQFKEEILKDQLIRIAKISEEIVEEIQESKDEYEYRLKMEFTFDYINQTILGLKMKNSNKIVKVEKCLLAPKSFSKILDIVPEMVDLYKIPVYKNRNGILKHLVLRYSPTENSIMSIFVSKTENFPSRKELANALLKKAPFISSVIHVMNSNDKIVLRGPYKVLKGEGVINYEFDWEKFQVPPTAFFQNNYFVTEKMIEYLTKGLNLEGTETVLDLYSGLGTFSMRLAALSKFVLAVEANHVSVKAGKANANINNLKNIKFVESDVEDFLIANENRFDIVVADPPRSGLGSMVISKILEMKPLKIGYISCNPSTMARDLKLFVESGEYEIEVIKPFDMFPQTYHVESLVLIKRKK